MKTKPWNKIVNKIKRVGAKPVAPIVSAAVVNTTAHMSPHYNWMRDGHGNTISMRAVMRSRAQAPELRGSVE